MSWRVVNEGGKYRVVVTKELPGSRWLDALLAVDCEVHISSTTHILSNAEIIEAIGDQCDAVLGQLTEDWGEELFTALAAAGGKVRSRRPHPCGPVAASPRCRRPPARA